MKEDVKKKWVAALRSNQYKQGRYFLRKGNSYCCLGVLCDVVGCEWQKKESGGYYAILNKSSDDSFLPAIVNEECDLDSDREHELSGLNDNGRTFQEIAQYIEENL